ncbi:MAG TPA: DUF2027 domain-containing protein [Bacteroidales bacterium]|nr:DUF2027 domain-containing protein [Bacteroidales bacterium]
MKYKAGDKVVFLNEKGGGVITRIINDQIVHVAIEEGFEIPYAVSGLLKVGSGNTGETKDIADSPEAENPDVSTLYTETDTNVQRPEGAYLAMVPSNQDKPLEGFLDVFLVNNSPYELLFGLYMNQSGNFFGAEFGFVPSCSKLFLTQIERNKIEDWVNGLAQCIFFKPGKASPLEPVSVILKFKPIALYKETSFVFEGLLRIKAFMLTLGKTGELKGKNQDPENFIADLKLLNEKINKGTGSAIIQSRKGSFLDKHKVDDLIAEIDLHINELTESTAGLSNAEMLNLQIEYFDKCMQQAWVDKLVKVIFIHGVGNGTLKNEITKKLADTPGIEFYDAPYARYGLGGTEVFFYRNQ